MQFNREIGFGENAIWLTEATADQVGGHVFWRAKFTPGLCAILVEPGTAAHAEAMLRRVGFVEQADRTVRGAPGGMRAVRRVTEPDDPDYSDQWGLLYINAPAGWDIRTDGSDKIVAVVDFGVFWPHPDLVDNIAFEGGQVLGASFYLPEEEAYCSLKDVPAQSDPLEYGSRDYPHGTPVASIIGARGNNDLGVCGVAWEARIMPVAFGLEFGPTHCDFDACYADSFVSALAALEFAMENGAKVINLSSGWAADPGNALASTIYYASFADILVVVCAHNQNLELPNANAFQYPAIYSPYFDNLITVGAIQLDVSLQGERWVAASTYGSNWSPDYVQIGAPGDNIRVVGAHTYTVPDSGDPPRTIDYCPPTEYFGATSAAAAFVSGVASKVWSEYPNLTAAQVRTRILDGARRVEALEAYFENGRALDLFGALEP